LVGEAARVPERAICAWRPVRLVLHAGRARQGEFMRLHGMGRVAEQDAAAGLQ